MVRRICVGRRLFNITAAVSFALILLNGKFAGAGDAARAAESSAQAKFADSGRVRYQLRSASRSLSSLESLVVDANVRCGIQVDPHRSV
jgi:hypothetical protein